MSRLRSSRTARSAWAAVALLLLVGSAFVLSLPSTSVASPSNSHLAPVVSRGPEVRSAPPTTVARAASSSDVPVVLTSPAPPYAGAEKHGGAIRVASTRTSPALSVTVSASPPSVDVAPAAPGLGEYTTQMTANVQGAVGSVGYSWSGLPPGCSNVDLQVNSCTPTAIGSYTVTVTVEDSTGSLESASLTLVVNPDPVVSITASPLAGPLPFYTHFTATFTGGQGPFTYVWNFGDGTNVTTLAVPHHQYYVVGHYTATLEATDADGGYAASSLVVAAVNQLSVSLQVLPGVNDYDHSNLDFNATIGNDSGIWPYIYAWNGLPAGCKAIDFPEISCSPTVAGTFEVSVTVTDGAGELASAKQSLVLRAIPSSPPSQPLASELAGVLALGVLFLAAALGIVAGFSVVPGKPSSEEDRGYTGAPSSPPPAMPAAPEQAIMGGSAGPPPQAMPESPPPQQLPTPEETPATPPPTEETPAPYSEDVPPGDGSAPTGVDDPSSSSSPPSETPSTVPAPEPYSEENGTPPPPPPDEPPAPSY